MRRDHERQGAKGKSRSIERWFRVLEGVREGKQLSE